MTLEEDAEVFVEQDVGVEHDCAPDGAVAALTDFDDVVHHYEVIDDFESEEAR